MKKREGIIIGIGMILFILIGIWVTSGNSVYFDSSVYNMLHMLPENICKPFFMFITRFGNTDVSILIIAILTFALIKKDGLTIAGVSILDIALNQSLKFIFRRERPNVQHLVHASGYSFPSGHTMIAIMLYGYMIYYLHTQIENKMIKYIGSSICIVLMIFVPISRIYVGVHYASDILGGVIIGFTALYFYICVISKLYKNNV